MSVSGEYCVQVNLWRGHREACSQAGNGSYWGSSREQRYVQHSCFFHAFYFSWMSFSWICLDFLHNMDSNSSFWQESRGSWKNEAQEPADSSSQTHDMLGSAISATSKEFHPGVALEVSCSFELQTAHNKRWKMAKTFWICWNLLHLLHRSQYHQLCNNLCCNQLVEQERNFANAYRRKGLGHLSVGRWACGTRLCESGEFWA